MNGVKSLYDDGRYEIINILKVIQENGYKLNTYNYDIVIKTARDIDELLEDFRKTMGEQLIYLMEDEEYPYKSQQTLRRDLKSAFYEIVY